DVLQPGREQLPHQVESREDVDAEHLLQGRRLDLPDGARVVDARGVHEQVHLAELLPGGADGVDAALLAAQICAHRERPLRRFLRLDRPGGAVAGAVAMVALGVLTPAQVYQEAISWDTLVLLLGMMVITSVMARAGIFRWIAWIALRRAHGPRALLAVLVLVAGTLSALLVNDTVCVMCTPLVIALVEAAALPALPYLLGLSFSSNAGSVATLTGNPQNMLI